MKIVAKIARNNWVGIAFHLSTHLAAIYALIWLVPFAQFVLPYPHKVVEGMVEADLALGIPNIQWILQHTGITIVDASLGFLLGNGMAVLLSIVMLFVPPLRSIVLRDAIAIKSIPWIVLIPILMLLVGPNVQTRIALVGLACFFPTLVNFYTGLWEVDHEVMDYTHTLPGITNWAEFRYVRWPYSLPFLFAAFKTSAGIVILSAVVVEWLVGGSGLGWLLYTFNSRYRMDLLLGLAVVTGLLSYGFLRFVSSLEHVFVDDSIWRGGIKNSGRI